MDFQHFRFLAPSSPLIQPSHLPYKLFRLLVSLFNHLFLWFVQKCGPRCNRKHIFKYRHKACLIKHLIFLTPKPPKSSPDCWAFRAPGVLWPPLTLQKVLVKPILFQRFRFLAPARPHIYPSYAQHGPKVTQKWSRATLIYPKWPRSDPKVTPKWP